jgi:hypothetical protein
MLDPSGGANDHDRWKQFGFLIADLFLVLALLFLLMTISAQSQVNALQTKLKAFQQPTPTPTITPTPTQLLRLDTKAVVVVLTVDSNGLLTGSKSASSSILKAIQGDKRLKGRRAGLVIAYGGTPDQSGIGVAEAVADKVNGALRTLGGRGQLFEDTTYHDSLFVLGQSHSYVKLEVYLFKIT